MSRGWAAGGAERSRWGAAVALCLGVAAIWAVTALAPTAAGPLSPATAGAQDCVWRKHQKRVVRWIRRNGHRRRVVRVRRWWRCHPIASPTVPVPVTPVDPDPDPVLPGRLGVRADEFSFTLSRTTVAAGDVIIELDNRGEDPHNLNLAKTGTVSLPLTIEEIGPLTQATGRFALTPGTYRLWCSLPLHEEWGMTANLTVSG
jgi:plastocyanin